MTTPVRMPPAATAQDPGPALPTALAPANPPGLLRRAARVADAARRSLPKVAEALATPLVPADYLDLLDPLRSGADLRGRVLAVTPETDGAATITIRPGRGWRGHVPGQYIRVGVDINGVRHWRAYSLTSPVGDGAGRGGTITITPKVIPGGTVSTYLVRELRPGTLIMLDQATGDFVLPDPAPERVLLVTGGSGITPVIGMLRNLDRFAVPPRDVVLVHCSPTAEDVLFRSELQRYAASGRLRLVLNLDDEAGVLHLQARLDALVPDWRERQAWVCGPTGMLDAAEEHWATAGLLESLHTERFRPAMIEAGEGGTVAFTKQGVVLDVDGGTPILTAGEDAGALLPSGCRMGICFTCVVPMTAGAVRDLRTGDVTAVEDDVPIPVQTCVNAAAGHCSLEV